jgi:hypothetical protein
MHAPAPLVAPIPLLVTCSMCGGETRASLCATKCAYATHDGKRERVTLRLCLNCQLVHSAARHYGRYVALAPARPNRAQRRAAR